MKLYAEHKERIDGLEDVGATVKTIEKIAASSVHTARISAEYLHAYRVATEQVLARLSNFAHTHNHPLIQHRTKGDSLLVVVTADRGDVGGLWHRVIEHALSVTPTYDTLMSVGTKGTQYLTENGHPPHTTLPAFPDEITWNALLPTITQLTNSFTRGSYRTIDLLYPTYESFTRQVPTILRLFPFTRIVHNDAVQGDPLGFPVFEPNAQTVYRTLLTTYSHTLFMSLAAQAKLAELVARTVAMEHAGAQTEREILQATKKFRRMRRESITNDQLTRLSAPQL